MYSESFEKYEYYVSNPYPYDVELNDIVVPAYNQNVSVKITHDLALQLKSKNWNPIRRFRDAEANMISTNVANNLNGIVNQIDLTYNLSYFDIGKLIVFDNSEPNTATVVKQSIADWPDELSLIHFVQIGNGQTTILPDSDVTIVSLYNLTSLAGKGATATLTRISSDVWVLSGSLG